MWHHWLNGILGLWVIALSFLGLDGAALTWTLTLTGIVIAVVGFSGAMQRA